MKWLPDLPEDTPTELIDFAAVDFKSEKLSLIERLTHDTITIGRAILKPNPGTVIGTVQNTVVLHEGDPLDLEWRVPENDHYEHKRIAKGDIHIHPADTLVFTHWEAASRIFFVALDRAFTGQIVDLAFANDVPALRTRIGIRDPVIDGMAIGLRLELQAQGARGRLFAESLATALIIHLFTTYADAATSLRPITGGLGPVRQKRVTDYIEAHYTNDISLCDLAVVAGLSPHYFSDAFKTSLKAAPHQFLIERRIHHAKELLLTSDLSIAEVALAVGFSGHSLFSMNFRRITGVTPLRFRLDRR